MNSPTAIKPSTQSPQNFESHLISLNIGGEKFTTTTDTLTQGFAANSMLATLVSTTLPTTRDKSGTIFIDRDGARFRVILNFLRCGTIHVVGGRVPCPGGGFVALEELVEEASFYSLSALRMLATEALSTLKYKDLLESVVQLRSGQARCCCGAKYTGNIASADDAFRLDAEF